MCAEHLDIIVSLLRDPLGLQLPPSLTPDTTFDEIGLDSLHRLELLDLIEATGRCMIDEPPEISTLGDLVELLRPFASGGADCPTVEPQYSPTLC
jgi:acyl carrier protein